MITPTRSLHISEFVGLVAGLTMLVAIGTDLMLASLDDIGRELNAPTENAAQLVVPIFLLGTGVGQIFSGISSDYLGRKPVMLAGLSIFILGSLICLYAGSFEGLLWGRFIQGLGSAAPRTVTQALVRDLFSGERMARIMSFVMGVFVLVPAIAPSLGQIVANSYGWRAVFVVYAILGVGMALWLTLRQPETLPRDARKMFSLNSLQVSFLFVIKDRTMQRYTLVTSSFFGAFFAFLSTFPQIMDDVFDKGEEFPLYFAIMAISLALSAVVNAKFVSRFGMRAMVRYAFLGCVASTLIYLVAINIGQLSSNLTLFMIWALVYFFCQGVVLGNIAALVLEPMGAHAGMATTVFNTASTICAIAIAIPMGLAFNGTIFPIVIGFAICALIAWILSATDR